MKVETDEPARAPEREHTAAEAEAELERQESDEESVSDDEAAEDVATEAEQQEQAS